MKRLNDIAIAAAAVLLMFATGALAQQRGDVFTVAKYPVDASGTNAVAAKRDAIAQGRKSAFRSLLKRLVPAQSYGLIEHLKKLDPQQYIASMRVRSEENSRTQYIATLDFSFDADALRTLLGQHGVPFVDQAAPWTSLLLLYAAPATGASADMKAGKTTWRSVWRGLDLANSVAPVTLAGGPANLSPEQEAALLAADPKTVAEVAGAVRTAQLVVAHAKPVPGARELEITLAGQDAVGRFSVRTRYRLDDDFAYSLELAAVIAQGVLEGRWKTHLAGPGAAGAAVTGGAATPLQVMAEFTSLGHWQRQQQVLAGTPGIRDLQIGGLSGRSATITLTYPGGGEALQAALGPRGLTLENINGFWVLR